MGKVFLEFLPVTDNDFDSVYADLERAFPYEERRTSRDERKLLGIKNFRFERIVCDGKTVGCTAYWQFDEFVFLEHIAINSEERGKGYGSETLRLLEKTYGKPIVLEVEPPDGGYASKRIAFYQRNGFVLNRKNDYIQPSYHGEEGVPLLIMSSEALSDELTEKFIGVMREFCYKAR